MIRQWSELLALLYLQICPWLCRRALEGFRTGEVQVLVSTDGMTRGMDIGELQQCPPRARSPGQSDEMQSQPEPQGPHQSGLRNMGSVRGPEGRAGVDVVSYDAPVYTKTLLHRMGRTARAGRGGHYYTLLRKEEVRVRAPARTPVGRAPASSKELLSHWRSFCPLGQNEELHTEHAGPRRSALERAGMVAPVWSPRYAVECSMMCLCHLDLPCPPSSGPPSAVLPIHV